MVAREIADTHYTRKAMQGISIHAQGAWQTHGTYLKHEPFGLGERSVIGTDGGGTLFQHSRCLQIVDRALGSCRAR